MILDLHRFTPEFDGAIADDAEQMIGRHDERSGLVGLARRGLRIRGRLGRREADVAVAVRDDLMDVAVEHGDRTEAA